MKGRRVEYRNTWAEGDEPKNGDYWRAPDGWGGVTPNGHFCNLSKHTVTEHADGTISVSPSIEVKGGVGDYWHGFLKRGVWKLDDTP
jgi:hypothetical protein